MEITNEQKQVMLSGLLGDGSVKSTHVSYNCMYREYMVMKRKAVGNLAKSEVIENDNMGYKKGSKIYSFSVKLNEYSKELVNRPLSEMIHDLDEQGLAYWALDDASLHRNHYFYNINTHSFSREVEENILIPKLNEFGIYPTVMTERKQDGRVFTYLYISKWNGGMEISRILRKYVPECYRYKLIPKEIEDAYFSIKDDPEFKSLTKELQKTKYFKKKFNIKQMSDMLINNTKGKKYSYEDLTALWESTFPKTDIVFCMYDSDEDESCIPQVNFLDDNPIVKGSYKISFNTWKSENMYMNVEGRSLTWKELIRILDEYNDGSHIFLEDFEVRNNNEVTLFLGS